MEGVSPLAIPAAFAWGSAAFILVAIDWSQVALGPDAAGATESTLIIVLSFISLVLGGLAAMVHDDIEHVLGYSILQDAGVAVLAFASLEPEVAAAARNWLVASATVKTALAAWCAVVRSAYGGHRLADLSGWARHSPVLGISFAAILVAAVGFPTMAIWESRSSLIVSAMPELGGFVTLLIAAMPGVYLGRIALAGVNPISAAVAAGPTGWPRWSGGRTIGWSDGSGSTSCGGPGRGPGEPRAAHGAVRAVPRRAGGRYRDRRHRRDRRLVAGSAGRRVVSARVSPPARAPSDRSRGHSPAARPAPNQRSISAAAVSALSEAWTRFWAVSRAKSPRIVPGAAS